MARKRLGTRFMNSRPIDLTITLSGRLVLWAYFAVVAFAVLAFGSYVVASIVSPPTAMKIDAQIEGIILWFRVSPLASKALLASFGLIGYIVAVTSIGLVLNGLDVLTKRIRSRF